MPGSELDLDLNLALSLDVPRMLAVLGLLLWIVAQYGLIVFALRDLRRRPAVRGGNKVAWALAVLAVPIVGPLAYGAVHPGVWPTGPAFPRRVRRRPAPPAPAPSLPASSSPPDICPPDYTPAPPDYTPAPPVAELPPAAWSARVDRIRRRG
jgi:hypothetical protein